MENLKYQVVTFVLVWILLNGYFGYLYVRIGRLRTDRDQDSPGLPDGEEAAD